MSSIPLKQLCLSSGLYCRKLMSGIYIHGTSVRRFTSSISNRILLPHIGASWCSHSDSVIFPKHERLLHSSYRKILLKDKLVDFRNTALLCYKHIYCSPLYCYEQNSCKSPVYRTLYGIHYNQCDHYCTSQGDSEKTKHQKKDLQELLEKENVLTVPNLLTMTRIILTPFLGYLVLQESFAVASVVFMIAGLTDLLDGYVARNFKNQTSAFGSFLDPLADKLLVSMLFVTLTLVHLIPVPLAVLVIARDTLLIAAAFYVRYISLPPPKTLARYFNATKVSAELKPLFISKLNTALQLLLVAASLTAPVFDFVNHPALQCLWYATAATTVASGVGYMFAKGTFRELRKKAV